MVREKFILLGLSLGVELVSANAAHLRHGLLHLRHKHEHRSNNHLMADCSSTLTSTTDGDCEPSTTVVYTTVIGSAVPDDDRRSTNTIHTTLSNSGQSLSTSSQSGKHTVTVLTTEILVTEMTQDATISASSGEFYSSNPTASGSDAPTSAQPLSSDFDDNPIIAPTSTVLTATRASEATTALYSTSASMSSELSTCPTTPSRFENLQPLFGFNMVNTKPYNIQTGQSNIRTTSDWQEGMALLKHYFPQITAVRLYSTMDGDNSEKFHYLNNSLPAAKANKLQILAGLWSTATKPGAEDNRFKAELEQLEAAITVHGCENIGAVSVGNEGLNDLNKVAVTDPAQARSDMVEVLIDQIGQTRQVLRNHACCVPVTHTDTWNELFNITNPWVGKLIGAVDEAIIANIFPYWGNAGPDSMTEQIAYNARVSQEAASKLSRDVWLGETGWAHQAPTIPDITSVADMGTAHTYWRDVGCAVLSGRGNAFWYVDWDEDTEITGSGRPSFGIFDYKGTPKFDLGCDGANPDDKLKAAGVPWLS